MNEEGSNKEREVDVSGPSLAPNAQALWLATDPANADDPLPAATSTQT